MWILSTSPLPLCIALGGGSDWNGWMDGWASSGRVLLFYPVGFRNAVALTDRLGSAWPGPAQLRADQSFGQTRRHRAGWGMHSRAWSHRRFCGQSVVCFGFGFTVACPTAGRAGEAGGPEFWAGGGRETQTPPVNSFPAKREMNPRSQLSRR